MARKDELLAKLENMMSRALSVKLGDKSGCPLIFIVQRFLLNHKLNGSTTPEDILTEAYLRARKAIVEENKEDISDMRAWFKGICFNIVREHKRAEQRNWSKRKKMQLNLQLDTSTPTATLDQYLHEKWSQELTTGLYSLKADDRYIIELRFVRELSWQEVTEALNKQREKPFKVEAVRQKGLRALNKLRKAFFSSIESTHTESTHTESTHTESTHTERERGREKEATKEEAKKKEESLSNSREKRLIENQINQESLA